MAKSQDIEQVTVNAYPRTSAELKEAIGFGNWMPGWLVDDEKAEKTLAAVFGNVSLTAKRTASSILNDAIDLAEKSLAGIELISERDAQYDAYVIDAQCPHCGSQKTSSHLTSRAIEDVVSVAALAEVLKQGARNVMAKCYAECIKHDPVRPRHAPSEATALCAKVEHAPLNLSAAHRISLPATVYANTYDFLDGTGRLEFVCRACEMRWGYDVTSDTDTAALVQSAASNIAYSHPESIAHGSRYWCSQCPQEDRLIDGLTSRECLENYSNQQRTDECHPNMQTSWRAVNPLTPLQLAAARTAWSAELRKRQAAAREKERNRVVVDYQGDD